MGFWSNVWNTAKAVGKGVVDVFTGIIVVMVLTVWAIGYVIFSIIDHLFTWIDNTIERIKEKLSGVQMVPPEDTEEFVKRLNEQKGKTVLPPYKPGVKRTLMVATGIDGKVKQGQIASTQSGFDSTIEEAFKRGNIVDQPIENE